MKHTDFRSLVHDIKRKEQQELCRALEAHGGSYSWWNAEEEGFVEDEHPIIAVNVNSMFPNPTDIEIRSVSVDNGHLIFVGEDKESGELVDFQAGDVFAGHLGYIIDLIPDSEWVDDVTTMIEDFAVPVSISRKDLEDIGFDADNISIKDMENIARCMSDLYSEYNYSEDLRMSAEKLSVPRLNSEKYDEWFGNLDFPSLERVTGFIQTDYSPEDGYQDFVDICDNWWEDLTISQRKEVYESHS